VPTIRTTYHTRRDTMLTALETHMPQGVAWTRPKGGLFIWLTLPEHMRTEELLQVSLEQKVAFVPGSSFYANGGGANTMRLNFSHSTPEQITAGVSRLAHSINAML
jgi:2-aminoadipate transaminase